ncbi:PKD domain-containing protein [Rhizobium phage vB_RleS_L338C]|uniref:PKD domain-containing protein n=1 Tax=Rhizobium phage vB_RleS_L338C TaxID=1414737 RepID=UPI0003D89273|nr:PKD domain-containing protein [Rhizobium phage vB_RleS_L338C]AHC30559.1 PKD domain-containing protein [Rhizobium phage vB_RleS_L338C]
MATAPKIFASGIMLGNPKLSNEVIIPVYEAPVMPPSYTLWTGANNKYGFLGNMVTEANAPAGQFIGAVKAINHPNPAAVYSMSGQTAGLGILADTGLIYVVNGTLLAVGTRTITITATNSLGSSSTTLQIKVVGTATNVIYIDPLGGADANTGIKPSQAIKTWAGRSGKGSGTKTYLIKNGSNLVAAVTLANGETIGAYGDPSQPRAKITTTANFGVTGTSLNNATVKDLDITAAQRAIHISVGSNFDVRRCTFRVPTDGTNRAPFYTTGMTGLKLLHCWVPANSYGDNVYCRGLKNAEIAYNLLETPLGSTADNLQVTSERNSAYLCNDVWIHHNTMINMGGTSAKGNCVIEGCVRAW